MRIYFEFALKKFQNKMVYRLDFFMGIINTLITIVVYLCIYTALYGDAAAIDGVTYEMVATNFVIALGLSQAFSFNEMFLPDPLHPSILHRYKSTLESSRVWISLQICWFSVDGSSLYI